MYIFPAIDLYEKKAVRLLKGDYNKMTVYNNNPIEVAKEFCRLGARHIHLVDLEGAKNANTPNIGIVEEIVKNTELFTEIGGGIRSMETVEKYIKIGVDRVILGTAAVKDEKFLCEAIDKYADKISVGIDIKDGFVAIKGWTESANISGFDFCRKLEGLGVKHIICTDISKDGAMQGTNHELYGRISKEFKMQLTASGGVSSIDDIRRLRELGIYGAIIGKAYYIGAINLKEAIEVAK